MIAAAPKPWEEVFPFLKFDNSLLKREGLVNGCGEDLYTGTGVRDFRQRRIRLWRKGIGVSERSGFESRKLWSYGVMECREKSLFIQNTNKTIHFPFVIQPNP